MTLSEFFAENPRCALAFSGGADSAYLLWAGLRWGKEVRPYLIRTPFQPEFEIRDARRLSEALGVALRVVELDVLTLPQVAENGPKRCYYCKHALFTRLMEVCAQDGLELVLDGTNASDDPGDRPGMTALAELGVRSPLRECGITKAQLRRLSREAGLFTWDKPAYACLATRIPTLTPITHDLLRRAEGAEAALTALGFSDFRVRLVGERAFLQLTPAQLPRALELREEILNSLAPFCAGAALDLQPRSPSL